MAEGKYARIAHIAQQYQDTETDSEERLTTRGKAATAPIDAVQCCSKSKPSRPLNVYGRI